MNATNIKTQCASSQKLDVLWKKLSTYLKSAVNTAQGPPEIESGAKLLLTVLSSLLFFHTWLILRKIILKYSRKIRRENIYGINISHGNCVAHVCLEMRLFSVSFSVVLLLIESMKIICGVGSDIWKLLSKWKFSSFILWLIDFRLYDLKN